MLTSFNSTSKINLMNQNKEGGDHSAMCYKDSPNKKRKNDSKCVNKKTLSLVVTFI